MTPDNQESRAAGHGTLEGAEVLLVEDNEVNQAVARELLEAMGITVTTVGSGQEAVAEAGRRRYDGVLMDIQMPVMGGIEATLRIRASRQLRELPIIAMTADTITGSRERILAAGMVDQVPKPIDPQQLQAVLLRWLRPGAATAAPAGRPAQQAQQAPLYRPSRPWKA